MKMNRLIGAGLGFAIVAAILLVGFVVFVPVAWLVFGGFGFVVNEAKAGDPFAVYSLIVTGLVILAGLFTVVGFLWREARIRRRR